MGKTLTLIVLGLSLAMCGCGPSDELSNPKKHYSETYDYSEYNGEIKGMTYAESRFNPGIFCLTMDNNGVYCSLKEYAVSVNNGTVSVNYNGPGNTRGLASRLDAAKQNKEEIKLKSVPTLSGSYDVLSIGFEDGTTYKFEKTR